MSLFVLQIDADVTAIRQLNIQIRSQRDIIKTMDFNFLIKFPEIIQIMRQQSLYAISLHHRNYIGIMNLFPSDSEALHDRL